MVAAGGWEEEEGRGLEQWGQFPFYTMKRAMGWMGVMVVQQLNALDAMNTKRRNS